MRIKKISTAITLSALTITLAACNGSNNNNNNSGSNQTEMQQVQVMSNGSYLLPSGAFVRVANKGISVQPGYVSSTMITVVGGTAQQSLGLTAEVYKVTSGVYTPTKDVTVSIENPNIETGSSTPQNTRLFVDARNAPEGTYAVKIFAAGTNPSNVKNAILTAPLSVGAANILKVSYVQTGASGSLAQINNSGYQASNILVFAFADQTSTTMATAEQQAIQTAITANSNSSTKYFLSIGGATNGPTDFNQQNVQTIVNNVVSQIQSVNQNLQGGMISGVDLDMENGIDAQTIQTLAQGFQKAGFSVSIAPQVYTISGSTVDPTQPTNLAFSAGGVNNNYQLALNSGLVNYIFAQTYNTGGWTVGGYNEGQVQFVQTIAQALNNTVAPASTCNANATSSSGLCIPSGTPIVIGEPSNAGASGNANNIFGVAPGTAYNQTDILNQFVSEMQTNYSNYPAISGVMQWSLNNDYDASGFGSGDPSAGVGTFSATVFGATPVVPQPPFSLGLYNAGPNVAGSMAYATVTLVVDDTYYQFGTPASWLSAGQEPIPPATAPNNWWYWGNSTAVADNFQQGIADYASLDSFFSNGKTSFVATQIIINAWPSATSALNGNPTKQWVCNANNGQPVTFNAGSAYFLSVDPTTGSCNFTVN